MSVDSGDRLTIVDGKGSAQKLTSALVCSALAESGDIYADTLEGNFGGRPYAIAVNGSAEVRPGFEQAAEDHENPIVETDVPAAPVRVKEWIGAGALAALKTRSLTRLPYGRDIAWDQIAPAVPVRILPVLHMSTPAGSSHHWCQPALNRWW